MYIIGNEFESKENYYGNDTYRENNQSAYR